MILEVDEDGSCKRPTTCEQFRFPNYQVWIKPLPADALALGLDVLEHLAAIRSGAEADRYVV